ncbi:hypothetical protein [Desulfoluna butyratoxydans]|nr:hypothetical protein [Desulfoluna butyratoxydans]
MKHALSVVDPASGKRVMHEKVVLICHGIDSSSNDETIDKEFACVILRTLIPDFSDGIDVEYIFARSRDGDTAARKMMTLSKSRGLDAFIIPDLHAMVMPVALGLAFPAAEGRQPVVVLVSQDETDAFKDRIRVASVAEPFEAPEPRPAPGVSVPESGPSAGEPRKQEAAKPVAVKEPPVQPTRPPVKAGGLALKLMTIGLCAVAGFLYYHLLMLLCGMVYNLFWEGAFQGSLERAGGIVAALGALLLVITLVPSIREEWLEVFGWICIAFAIPAFIGAISFYDPAETAGFQAFVSTNARSVVLMCTGLLLIVSGFLFVRFKP